MGADAIAQTFKKIENYSPAQLKDFITSQGVPYHEGYICAETTSAVLKANGISTPQNYTFASSYNGYGTAVSPAQASVGDIIVYKPSSPGTTGHVGVITGFNEDGTAIVHSGNGTEVDVRNQNLNDSSISSITNSSSLEGAENAPAGGANPNAGGLSDSAAGGAGGLGGAGGAAGGAVGAAGAQIGGAGCKGGGPSPAGLLGAGGLMGNLGGLAQGALMSGAMAALSGAGIQGIMGGMLGSVGGALGNALGASLGGSLGAIAGQALGGAVGAIVAGQNPLQALTGAAMGAIGQMGSSLIPGLSNVMPPEIASAAVNGLTGALGALARGAPPGAAMQYALAGGLGGAINGYINNMTGNYALGSLLGSVATGALTGQLGAIQSQGSGQLNLLKYANNISAVAGVVGSNRILVGAISEAMSKGFGGGSSGGYGTKVRNMQDMMTFSVSTLGQNINAVAYDMIALGRWDASNLMRLMQPGNIAAQILSKGLGGYTGLTDQLTTLGVPIAGIDNPLFDKLVQQCLNNINGTEEVATVMTAFSMMTKLNNLGELTILEKMMPNSYGYMPIKNFRELGVQLAIIGIKGNHTIYDIGQSFSKVETSTDLNHIQQLNEPLPAEVGTQLLNIYGYGGGTYGEQTMADFMGTVAGYVHEDTIPVIVQTTNFISNHPEASLLNDLSILMKETSEGKYTDPGTPEDTSTGVPAEAGSITIPFPVAVGGTKSYSTLDDAMLAFVPLIETEHQNLLNTTDTELLDNIKKLDVAYRASCAQLVREANNLHIHNIDLFNDNPVEPSDALTFMDNVEGWASETGYGQPGHFIDRVCSNDIYGDAIKYHMRQARNAIALEGLGIDVEQHRLPQSQYYRDPEGFYESMYTGQFPAQPQNKLAMVYPRTPNDVYLFNRNNALNELGYGDAALQNNQKDEIFYDSQWMDTNETALEDIGRQLVKTAIDRNIEISGDNMYIVDLEGNKTPFGQIKDNGLLLTNNEELVLIMMKIVNRLLYGDLLTTKYENPFNTDQMIWGVLELLAQVTNQNIEALMKTVTGGLIANGLLDQLLSRYGTSRSLYDTGPNRNDPAAYGGTGPDAKP